MRFHSALCALTSLLACGQAYWLEEIAHSGVAPFAGADFKVFRNVKDYGAKGDGATDDTEAINAAIRAPGNRCYTNCASSTTTPVVLYFPAGTYAISKSIIPYYFTQLVGDPTNRPVLKATAGFQGFGLIDGNPYGSGGQLTWVSVNTFFRQVRNFVIDTTNIPAGTAATGMHWPTSQATSLQNIEFRMPTSPDVVHVGLFVESGSGGFMSDLSFTGGATGASMGNQQYVMRNFVFHNCKTAIIQLWSWSWQYIGLSINNCGVGIDISAAGDNGVNTGSVTLIDSTITNTPIGLITAKTSSTMPRTAGSLVLENVDLDNVPVAVKGPSGTLLAGSSGRTTVNAWADGNSYLPDGPRSATGTLAANTRPATLLDGGSRYYTRSKPMYENLPVSSFVTVRSHGAKGDAATDDTAALQAAIDNAASNGKVVFIDFGLYKVTNTITIPPGSKIVGEGFPVLLAAGAFFADQANPKPVVRVGSTSGQAGLVELSDFVVSTQGPAPGATLIQWNLASTGQPSAMWDIHTRIGGFTGSQLQVAQCNKTPGSDTVNPQCIAAYMSMHVTAQATGLYMENVWLWTADHDIDDNANTQTNIYAGRGLYIESTVGRFWLVGTASEHHVLYNYQFANTQNIFAAQLQTETPYFMPTPNALVPFRPNPAIKDPDFSSSCTGVAGNCAASWGLRVIDSHDILIYGAGHYSFFSGYSTNCSTVQAGQTCQSRIVSLEGNIRNVNIYALNTIGSLSMLDRDGKSLASWQDNVNVFPSNIIAYRSG